MSGENLRERLAIAEQRAEREKERANKFCEAYWRERDGTFRDIRLNDDGTLDEIVGNGGYHIEQMDDNLWFFDLGGIAFFMVGVRRVTPRDEDTWEQAKQSLNGPRNQ